MLFGGLGNERRNYMYRYVTDKHFLKSAYSFCADLVNQLVQELKHYDIDSCMEVVGSGRHGFITQNETGPIDFDFNLWIINEGIYFSGHDLKEQIMTAFNYVLDKNGYGKYHCDDSTSAITVGRFKFKKGNQTEFSIDVAIVKEDEQGNWHRLIHQKTGIVQMDRWIWNIGPDSREIFAKEEFLKNGHWNEVRCAYLEKKNAYINVSTKPSFICYIEAINDVYNQYHKNVSRNIGGFYSIWGQGDFYNG